MNIFLLGFVIGTVAGAWLLSLFALDADSLDTVRALVAERQANAQRVADAERAAEAYRAQLVVITSEVEAKICAAFNDGWVMCEAAGVAR